MNDTSVQTILMLVRLFENGRPSKMLVLAPPMADAHIQYMRALWTIASGNSWQSLQASVTYMKYTPLRSKS